MAGLSVLRNYYAFDEDRVLKGFMVSTQRVSEPYVKTFADLLGASSVEGWFHVFMLPMNEPLGSLPSLLILDDFTLDSDRKNLDFIERLYKGMNPPDADPVTMIVVVITHKRDAADALCSLNGGYRVRPMEGFYTGTNFIKPQWKSAHWNRALLIDVVKYHHPNQFEDFSFVKEGTPYLVLQKARSKVLSAISG
jgi:hypothetical protein